MSGEAAASESRIPKSAPFAGEGHPIPGREVAEARRADGQRLCQAENTEPLDFEGLGKTQQEEEESKDSLILSTMTQNLAEPDRSGLCLFRP